LNLWLLFRNSPIRPTSRAPFLTRRYRYRQKQLFEALGPELSAATTIQSSDSPPGDGPVSDAFQHTADIHKILHYLPVYESALPADRPIRMLEIGVFHGGSLQMWRDYLHSESIIVGIDIDPATKQFDDPARQIHVRIGAQQDAAFLRSVVEEFGPFDVILDDGSHVPSHMVASFRYLFSEGLKPGGAYLVEDILTNYWTVYRDQPMSFVDFSKWLIDAMHAHYLQMFDEPNIRQGHPDRLREVTVPLAGAILEKVEFYDSIAVFHRSPAVKTLPRSVYRGRSF
jgi:cephalosporin hydroxylase